MPCRSVASGQVLARQFRAIDCLAAYKTIVMSASAVGVVVFSGLSAYDTQKIKQIYFIVIKEDLLDLMILLKIN